VKRDKRFIRKNVGRIKWTAKAREQARQSYERSQNRFGQHYKFRPGWLKRKVVVPPEVINERVNSDDEIKELREWLAMSMAERKRRAKKAFLAVHEGPARLKVLEIQAEIDPVVEKIVVLDRKMRQALQSLHQILYESNHLAPPHDVDLRNKIKVRTREIVDATLRQFAEYETAQVRIIHDRWNKRYLQTMNSRIRKNRRMEAQAKLQEQLHASNKK